MKYFIGKLLLIVGSLVLSQAAYGQRLAVKTDALKWSLCTPNLGMEFSATEHTSFGADVTFGFSMYGLKEARFWSIQPEWRYWFNGRPMIRQYVGLGALVTQYDFTSSKRNVSGDAAGLGLTLGNAWMLSRRWNVEIYCGLGLVAFRNKEKYIDDNIDDYYELTGNRCNNKGYHILPTKFGVSFAYILL